MATVKERVVREVITQRTVTIEKSPEGVYRFWRNLKNLKILGHIKSIEVIDDKRSHWVAQGPAGMAVEWDAVITRDIENERIDWESVGGSDMVADGSVLFRKAPGDRGTEVQVLFRYKPPLGEAGVMFAKLFGQDPSRSVREDLRRFKQLMETGETPSTAGQPSGA
ncbi:MAG: SRPBCC family protein [Desulfovibrionales bacterium]